MNFTSESIRSIGHSKGAGNRRQARPRFRPFLEALERRYAPATLVNESTLTYQDIDGDNVTVQFSKPLLGSINPNNVFAFNTGSVNDSNADPQQLRSIDVSVLSDPGQGISISVTATRSPVNGGDGFANVGVIIGEVLGHVFVDGDLRQILVGYQDMPSPTLASLAVHSMGRYGDANGGTMFSDIMGSIGKLTVRTDMIGVRLHTFGTGAATDHLATIDKITIGGSLIGEPVANTGSISSAGKIKTITIGGDVVGGAGQSSGAIHSNQTIGKIQIGGSLWGGTGGQSGRITTNGILGLVRITGDIRGDSGSDSGTIRPEGPWSGLQLGGSLIGGNGGDSGAIYANDGLGPVVIRGDMRGGAGSGSGSIEGNGVFASIVIGRSVIGGTGNYSPNISNGGASIGPITIGGDFRGGDGDSSASISPGDDLASLTIGGSLIGGSGLGSGDVSGDKIGPVRIGGDLRGGAGGNSGHIGGGQIFRISIAGSVLGGDGTFSGSITSSSDEFGIGPVNIAGNVQGGAGDQSAAISTNGPISSVNVGGSLVGVGPGSGKIECDGNLGPVFIRRDILGGGDHSGTIITFDGANIASVSVSGSVVGGQGVESGTIVSSGNMGRVTIARDLQGGGGDDSGGINSSGLLAGVAIGGSMVGLGTRSALIFASDDMGPITLGRDLRGGTSTGAGRIFGLGDIASITIGGSIVGGYKDSTGYIQANGQLGALNVSRDIRGGDAPLNQSLEGSGYVQADRIVTVFVGGSIISGRNDNADPVTNYLKKSGSIRAQASIGRVDVLGSLIGNSTNPMILSAVGAANPSAPSDVAFASITVGKRVEWANILAGYNPDLNALNADAQINLVTVGHDWIASNLVAGAFDDDGDGFGLNDNLIPEATDDPGITARIGTVLIGGQAIGTVGGTDHFGIVTQFVGSCTIGGTVIPLAAGAANDEIALGPTGDFRVLEVA